MSRRPGALLALLLLLLALPAPAASARRRVCVLYFDNNTARREYDVLQKGLADMLVTDLSAVESLEVVEREKLQALIEELKLQHSRYFDPATARQLGKLAGAELAVTGAIAELEPTMRLDVRLVEVSTGKVLLAEKVTGEARAFFDLQQELVDVFVKGLEVKLKASARAKSGATGLDGLLTYSRGVDAADRGDLQAATAALAEAVRESPDFALARARQAELLRRLEASSQRRATLFSALEAELLQRAEARTSGGLKALLGEAPPADADGFFRWQVARRDPVQHLLGSRALRLNLHLAKVARRFRPEGNAPGMVTVMAPGDRVEVLRLVREILAATEQLLADQALLAGLDSRLGWRRPFFPQLPPDDTEKLKAIDLVWGAQLWADSAAQAEADLGKLLLTGATGWWGPGRFAVRPTPVQLDPALEKVALGHLAHAEQAALALPPEERGEALFAALDAAGEGLLALGRREEAVARWQRFLDAFPTHARYKDAEKKVRQVLCATEDCRAFEAALGRCHGPTLMLKSSLELPRVAWAEGVRGLTRVVKALETACPQSDPAYPQLGYHTAQAMVLLQVAAQAQGLGECGLYDQVRRWLGARAGETYATSFAVWAACQEGGAQ